MKNGFFTDSGISVAIIWAVILFFSADGSTDPYTLLSDTAIAPLSPSSDEAERARVLRDERSPQKDETLEKISPETTAAVEMATDSASTRINRAHPVLSPEKKNTTLSTDTLTATVKSTPETVQPENEKKNHSTDKRKKEKSGTTINGSEGSDTVSKKSAGSKWRFNPFAFLKRKKSAAEVPLRKRISPPDKTATEKPLKVNGASATSENPVEDPKKAVMDTASRVNVSPNLIPIPQKKTTPSELVKTEWRFFKTSKIISSLIILIVGWFALRYSSLLMNILSERWPQYRLLIKGFIPVVRIVGWTFLIGFVIVGIFKPPIQSVLAFTASAGIAIGFASQDILKNIFGGVVILFDKPFKVGDKIQIDSFYGEVISIGIRTVRIVTMDDSVIAIPNSEIVSKSVSNANSGEPDCQVIGEFYFNPDLDLDKAFILAKQCAAISRYIYLNKPIAVVFKNEIHLGRNMIHMRLKAYVIDHRFEMPFVTDMSRTVYREFRKAGLMPTALS